MAWIDPRAEEYLRRRFTRADAYRLAPPGSPEAKMPGWLDPSATRVRAKEAAEEEARARAAAEQEAFEREVRDMRTLVGHLKSYLALSREAHRSTSLRTQADRALERFNRAYAHYFSEGKADFDPNQPRVPAAWAAKADRAPTQPNPYRHTLRRHRATKTRMSHDLSPFSFK